MDNTEHPIQGNELSNNNVLQQAIRHHTSGELKAAEACYQSILADLPNHPVANHNLGVLALQDERATESLPYFMAALDADPTRGAYWADYIDALIKAGQLEDARQVLALTQQHGLQGEAIDSLASLLKSETLMAAAIDTKPLHPSEESIMVAGLSSEPPQATQMKNNKNKNKHFPKKIPNVQETNSLITLYNEGLIAEAAKQAKTMTTRFPDHWLGWKMLGVALNQLGLNAEATEPMQRAVELLPNDAEALHNLGTNLQNLGRLQEAEAIFRHALQIAPDYVNAYRSLGATSSHLGRLDDAERYYRQAIAIDPHHALTHCNLGTTLHLLGRLENAEVNYRKSINLNPNDASAHCNLGAVMQHLGQLDAAEVCYRDALRIAPNYALAYSNLGIILQVLGRLDEAITCMRQALTIDPNSSSAHTNLLYCLSQSGTKSAMELFSEHCRFGEKFEAPLKKYWHTHKNTKISDRRLKIGFISGDFRNHAVSSFIAPILAYLSTSQELTLNAYYNHSINDNITNLLKGYFDSWCPIVNLSDSLVAEKITSDEIDILIDLSGHTANNRLLAFARKLAPIQVSWIGYPGTTGLTAMDYYFSDRYLLPIGKFDSQFTEKIVRLPGSVSFLPSELAPSVNVLPAIANGYLTFGSFNRLSKISPEVVAVWSKLMRSIPTSKLLIGAMPEVGKYDTLIEWFKQEGIALERLNFYQNTNIESYLSLHQKIDICLDTFPYNGGTTTLNAIWMGVPTLTIAGDTVASRSGASVMGHVGLESFIVSDSMDFHRMGLFWASHIEELAGIRSNLREQFSKSAFGQPKLIATGIEQALRTMWKRWCEDLPIESFQVDIQNSSKK